MANNSPTIVAASLSDDQLKKSIDSLVSHVDEAMKKMVQSTNNAVGEMEAKLKSLGNLKIDSGGSADGGASKRAKAQNAETDSVEKSIVARDKQIKKNQEAATSFDQMAKAQQVAIRSANPSGIHNADTLQTMNIQLDLLRERLREARQQYSSFVALAAHATTTGDKGLFQYATDGVHRYEQEVHNLIPQIRTLQSGIQQMGDVISPQGHTIQNYVNSIQKANPELAQLNEQFKRGKTLLQQQKTEFEQNAQAQRNSANATNQQKQTLDEMNAYIRQNIQREQERRDAIRQTGLAARETTNQLIRSAHEQASSQGNSPITGTKELAVAIEQMRRAYFDMSASEKMSPIGIALEADIKRANDAIAVIRKYNQSLLGSQQNDANKITNASTLNSLRESLRNLTEQYNRLTVAEINAGKGDALIQHFQDTTRAAQILQKTLNRPVSLKSALSGDERTLDDIAYKMQRLRAYKQGIDLTKPNAANEIKQVDEALARLQKDADKWMSKSQEMIKSNTALGRSWNYMKNRLAFYFTVGASTSFIKNLIEVRSQYEMNERALGILIDSAERGTQIFNELSQMALVSPYTLIELSTAAKQLTAYDVAAKDVVDTTRRLADMAAAVGIPIERLTYALGQIKAYGYLNSRDARMFANAGIPLVKQLSDYYTELEGRLVSTADVYDRIKKKAIDYNEVMEVINKMTDQGGKFFDFQAKMADTLKVRLANLTLAWNNMLNDMGKESQGVLTWGIGALREMFLHWKQLDSLIKNAAWALGIRTTLMFIAYSALKVGAALGVTTKQMALSAVFGKRLADVLKTVASAMKTVAMSKWTWISLFAIAAVEATQAIFGVNEAQKALNESIRNGAKDNYNNISKFLEQYKEIRESLYATQKVAIGNIYNPVTRKAEASSYAEQQVGQDIDKNEAKKAWEAVREQIELTVASSDKYIGNLLSISNMSERVRQGFNLLDDVQVVNAALKELDDDTIKVSKDISAWWNAWQAPDGLIGNLKDLVDAQNELIENYGSVEAAKKRGSQLYTDYEKRELANFRDDLQETTDSIINFIELKGWSGDESKINQVFEKITQKLVLDNQLDPQKAFTLQTEVEEARSKAAKQALLQRINDEKAAYKISHDESVRQALNADIERYNNWNETNGRSKVEWERFTKWLKEQHISETTAMFRNMDAEDIRSLNFQEGKHAEWVTRMVTQYAKEHKMSYDEAFKYLKSWVRSANQWSIYIPLTISTENKKSIYDQLGEYDKAVDEADAQIERLTKRIGELNAKKQKSKEETQELANAEQELADAQKAKADAEAKGGHGKKEKKDERAANKAAKQAESELQKALKDELSTIDKVRSIYKDLAKEGMSHANAVERATKGWDETVNAINRVLQKNGLRKLDLSKFAGIENPRELVNMLQSQLNTLLKRGAKPAEIKELQTKVNTLEVDADKYDLTKITKGLNNELGKLKDEYELAVELDANPELGDMFADMFGINTSMLPKTFGDALDRAQTIINRKLTEMNITTPFDLMEGNIDSFAKATGLDKDGAVIKELVSAQNAYRYMFKKNITETEKILDDYIKKYGDYSDKIAEIEAGRLEKLKKLNEAYYTEEMRKRPEYIAKLNAIEQGASKEKQQVDFDEFKNSRYYTMMFENLDYISTKTIRDMRDRVRELMDTMNDLTTEQLKTLISQYEKLEQKLVKRSPFKTLTKDLKEYFATTKERKAANVEFKNAQKEYDVQKKNVAALKEKYEQAKANTNTSQSYLDFLRIEVNAESDILDILLKQLNAAQKKADKYNLIKKLAESEAELALKTVAANLSSLKELRDNLQESFGFEFSDDFNLAVDGLSKVGDGMSKAMSALKEGNVVAAISGVADVVKGLGDTVAGVFGAGRRDYLTSYIERFNKLVEIMDRANEIQMKSLEEMSGSQAARKYKELQTNYQKIIEGYREAAERGGSSGGGAYTHTYAYRTNERLKGSWDEISEYAGKTLTSVQEMYSLSPKQLQNIMVNAPELWSRISPEIRENLEKMIEYVDKSEELAEKLGEAITGMSLNDVTSEFEQMLQNMDSSAKDFEKDFEKDMRNAIIRSMMVNTYSKELEQWYEHFKQRTEDDNLSETDVDQLRSEYMDIVRRAMKERDRLLEAVGGMSDQELSALQQGIAGVSEETASAVEAYLNGMSQQAYLRNDLLVQIRDTIMSFDMDVQLGVFSQILLQLQQSYAVQMAIQGILEGWNNPSGQAVRVELVS